MDSDDPAGWIAWQAKGNAFLEVSDNCPFCASVDIDKATARQVSVEYESASVRTLSTLRATVERLGRYIESEKRGHLESLLTSIGDLSPEQAQFLAGLRGQIETFLLKLNNLRGISFETLRDVDDLGAVLSEMKIDLGLLDSLASEDTRTVVELINERLDEVIARINSLRAQVGKLKTRVASLIRLNQAGINAFLASAGYRYRVRIESTADSYRMILEHEDAKGHVESASEHLSYGEKNAFALILFMYHVRRERQIWRFWMIQCRASIRRRSLQSFISYFTATRVWANLRPCC